MKRLLLCFFLLFPFVLVAQKVSLNPTITPALFRPTDQITVTYDVTGTSLASLTNAWIWVWIPGATTINAQYNINPATEAANLAKFDKTVVNGRTLFTKTFIPSNFFSSSIASQTKLGMLLKANDWANGQTTDYVADFWDGSFQIKLTSPTQIPLFVANGEVIPINAETPVAANYKLYVNDQLIDQVSSVTNYSYNHTVTETSGSSAVRLTATVDATTKEASFDYIISSASPFVQRPAGIIPGINYNNADPTKVTLCLLAPDKTSVYVRGDFSDWEVQSDNLMNRDGEFFWIELSGLTSGVEYGYQYLVDENIWLSDPYADKILDPDDQYIDASTYPNLKPYPAKALSSEWYKNRVAVFQTNQNPYVWQVANFQKPAKEKLVIYELLIRDFFDASNRNYQNLIDTITYFKRLGVNAIELMPIMEFGGNNSWGYNPQFMFAPDKSYGTKNKLKEFVDVCHQNGIAVILDIAMNHQDAPNPYLFMDFNFTTFKPNPTNKWFNVNATHPYSVFFDMNHESQYTKNYLDTITHYWLNEFKVDGYRFDLSKGFTQTNNPNNVDAWGQYDASRVALLKRMADKIWSHTPEAYVILEHFAANTEEKELAEYRFGEGKGMMLWGNLNYSYGQNSMGYSEGSDFSWIYHANRGWSTPHVVGYMESHDEERMMYRNLQYGNQTPEYSVKDLNTALNRVKASSTIFYTIPGPKMLWQFGELGYDYSINYCESDGTINSNCRTYPKPIKWEYRDTWARYSLYNHISDLIQLRNTYDVFSEGNATVQSTGSLLKQVVIKNIPYTATPATADEMNAVVAVNFNVTTQSISINFPHTGTWYDYFKRGTPIVVDVIPYTLQVKEGGYKIFTDVEIENMVVTETEEEIKKVPEVSIYPNPSKGLLNIEVEEGVTILGVKIRTIHGSVIHPISAGFGSWNISEFPRGIYFVEILTNRGNVVSKLCKD